MRFGAMAVLGAALCFASAAHADGREGGYFSADGSTRGIGSGGGAAGESTREFLADPTGTQGASVRIGGSVYGDTRGPGANEIQPDRVSDDFRAHAASKGGAQPSLGHVPTDQELARGAPTASRDPGPIPRPQLNWEPTGY